MIDELKCLTKGTVMNYVRDLGRNTEVYSNTSKGLEPMLRDHDVYVYANFKEVIIVALDPRPSRTMELADEEPFNDEKPLWFTEKSHRISPVHNLAVACLLFRERLRRLSHHAPAVYGLLLTECEIINYGDDMLKIWASMGVAVFDRLSGLSKIELPVNTDASLPVAASMSFAFEGDYSSENVHDAESKLLKEMKKAVTPVNPNVFHFDDDDDLGDEFTAFFKKYDDGNQVAEDDTIAENRNVDDEDEVDDLSDYDINDAVQTEPTSLRNRLRKVVKCERENEDHFLKNISDITMKVATGSLQPIYNSGSLIVTCTGKKGSYFKLDGLRCFVYTKDFRPMCNSIEASEVIRSRGSRLTIDMYSSCIWLPGSYFLLLTDSSEKVQRLDFSLDDNLCATIGEWVECLPCSQEDILISYLEKDILNWPQLAMFPGGEELRKWIIRRKQLDAYNEYRSSLYRQKIGVSSNLLICKWNDDISERFLKMFFDMSDIAGHYFKYLNCSTLFDPTSAHPYEALNEELNSVSKTVVCITNIGTLQNTGGKVIVRKIMDIIFDKRNDNILWMCGTRNEVDSILSMYPSLGSLFLKDNRLEQESYSAFDLVQAFSSRLIKQFLYVPGEVKDALARTIVKGCSDQSLSTWSLESVNRHVAEEVCPHYLQHALTTILSEEVDELSVDDLCLDCLTKGFSSFEDSMRELNNMIGLDEVKKGIMSMAYNSRLIVERKRRGLNTSQDFVCHCVFTGNPGTGKTTVAKMLGRIYRSIGLLSKGEVVYVDRAKLVGQYIGETESNMRTILEESRGNVLFIDEAYTLVTDSGDRRDFGLRVIDSLMTVLTQPNPDMLIVFAGYPEEMEHLLSTNPGLASRFPYHFRFADYDQEQLMEIAHRLLEHDDYILTADAEMAFKEIIKEKLQNRAKDFGNARWITTMIRNGIVPALAGRVFSAGTDDFQHIYASDVRIANEKLNPKPSEQEKKPSHKRIAGFCTVILAIAMIFGGCHRNSAVDSHELNLAEAVSPASDSLVTILDSMLVYLNADAEPSSKASYEWKWAGLTRVALGKAEDPIELDSLDVLSFEVDKQYSPLMAGSLIEASDAAGVFSATAKFRLLNSYHVLAYQLSQWLDEDWLLQDYALWEAVYKEYEQAHYNTFGRSTTYMLGIAHKTLCELRHSILKEEIGYFDLEYEGVAKWFVEASEIQWNPEHKAIRLWYDHRIKMADKLGNTDLAKHLRKLSLKAVFVYSHLQLDFM